MKNLFFIFIFLSASALAESAHDLKTNQIHMADAPSWLTATRIDKVVAHMDSVLEWDIRRIEVIWYKDEAAFEKFHGQSPSILALTRKADNATMHLGPKITTDNFDAVFGHELVHVILYQKYHDVVPGWLEEGLANHLSKFTKVDYKWLARHPAPGDVRELTHPLSGSEDYIRYHYVASQALMEMIAGKCDLINLLRISVRRKLEDKLDTFCGIKDVNAEFKKWLSSHSG
jgi:hypothetical protein